MNADGTRDTPGFGTISVLMPPGKYSATLTVNGQSFTQPLEVLRDPNQRESLAEIRAAADALLTLQKALIATGEMIGQIESVRSQAQALTSADVRAAGDSLEHKFMDVEGQLFDLRMTGRGQDEVRWPARAAQQVSYLAGGIGASDFTPTTQQREVQVIVVKNVRDARSALDQLLRTDLPAFNALLRAKGLKTITVEPALVFVSFLLFFSVGSPFSPPFPRVALSCRRAIAARVQWRASRKLDRAPRSAGRQLHCVPRATDLRPDGGARAIRGARVRGQSIPTVRQRRAGVLWSTAVRRHALALRDPRPRAPSARGAQRDRGTRVELGRGASGGAAQPPHRIPAPG